MLTAPLRMKAKNLEKKEKKEPKEDADVIRRKIMLVMEEVRLKTERRNAYMNLAWTGPIDNTGLEVNIPYDKVANMAVDMFCDTSSTAA